MTKGSAIPAIRLRGVRQNNLKNFDLDLPLGKLIVMTGLSGSGKSSLAFDTLYAEGQRRYVETFSPYARQFFDRMDKPAVDSIDGIPPAIALEQKNSVKTTRSTVGTMTELTDYMKVLWLLLAKLYCRNCGRVVQKDSPQSVFQDVTNQAALGTLAGEFLITFDLALSEKVPLDESLALIAKQGYTRLFVGKKNSVGEIIRVDEGISQFNDSPPSHLTVIQDRLSVSKLERARFVEACQQAFHFGKGKLALRIFGSGKTCHYSSSYHCAECDIEYKEPSVALFSFNNPVGACPTCKGFGRTITIDYEKAIPDRTLSIRGGLVKPWQSGHGEESQDDLVKFCKARQVPMDVPFNQLEKETQDWIINGDPGYGKDAEHQWPQAWYGLKGYFRWLESKAYKMHVRVLLARYRAYVLCPDCQGQRFQPAALLYKSTIRGKLANLSEFYQLPVSDALGIVREWKSRFGKKGSAPWQVALSEVEARLAYLNEVGLSYLTLDRSTRSLSGGETERVNLTTSLGSRLVNTLFVLDEPSVGLHPRDTEHLVNALKKLRDAGNTVVVVEHESSVMRAADLILDLGPGHGRTGGEIVAFGTFSEICRVPASLTAGYLSGRLTMPTPPRRPVDLRTIPKLTLTGASLHNLSNLQVEFPLNRFICVTGVSGSGKSTLITEILHPLLQRALGSTPEAEKAESDDDEQTSANPIGILHGAEKISQVIMVDQSSLGRTPRSNPAVYTGAFEFIRELFSRTSEAAQRGLSAGAFSFNSKEGQCERCKGAGFEKIEMQFLSDVFVRCPECNGRRYREHILQIRLAPPATPVQSSKKRDRIPPANLGWNIAEVLEATVDEAVEFLVKFEGKHAQRALHPLRNLQEVGLGYLQLGQPVNTLSGGESQRLKLATHLSEFGADAASSRPCLFIFDEPTTGLHFEDVRVLLQVFQRMVEGGHSVLVIEHNLNVIDACDWVIDLGPEGGAGGGRLVAQGSPEIVAKSSESHTGVALLKEARWKFQGKQ
jgi:excinuclease ABC subunit A